MFEEFKKNVKQRWQTRTDYSSHDMPKQKAFIIGIAIILAFLLWLVVNLNRSYTVNIQVPLELGKVSADRALAEELPQNVTARVSGEGWNLLSVYQDPPQIFIEVSDEQINLFDQVRRQMQAESKLRVESVDPLYLSLHLQKKVSKKVPIVARLDIKFANQYGFLESPQLQPDSVVVSGAQEVIKDIQFWATDSLTLKNVKKDISMKVPLSEAGPLLSLSAQQVQIKADVVEYTEGEVSVPVELRNTLVQRNVIFSPQEVTITYLAPIKEFPDIQEQNVFEAYVTYPQLVKDTTGFVSPRVVQSTEEVHVKIQQVQPRQVAYFNIISENK